MDEYARQAQRLATNYISTRSVAIVIRDRVGNSATGTSTCVQVGAKFLLATAAHVVEDVADQRIQLIPAGELASQPLQFMARSCYPGKRSPSSDVGWIQLDPKVAEDSRLRFISVSDIKLGQDAGDRWRSFLVHGYPHQSAILTPTSSDVESTVAATLMAKSAELHRPLNAYEVATEYPPRDAEDRPLQVAPTAHGLSGGGVWWHPKYDENDIFSPTYMKLVALNTRWHARSAVLFATRIDEWLDLVARDFPDTSTEITRIRNGSPV